MSLLFNFGAQETEKLKGKGVACFVGHPVVFCNLPCTSHNTIDRLIISNRASNRYLMIDNMFLYNNKFPLFHFHYKYKSII